MYVIFSIVLGISTAAGLSLYALKQNVDLYLTPNQVMQHHFNSRQVFRLGGMVKKGSFYREPGTMHVKFTLTDFHHEMKVEYTGVLPMLFRVGQGIVVQGHLKNNNIFVADQVLAKHDAKYMPPGLSSKI